MFKDIYIGLKKLPFCKVGDLEDIKNEMLKWKGKETHIWISDMLNCVVQPAISHDWSTFGSNLYITRET